MKTTDQHKHTNKRRAWPGQLFALAPLLAVALLGAQQAQAIEFETGEDWTVHWDNTLKFNYGIRVEDQDDAVFLQGDNAATGILADDGDLGWDQWDTTTARLDILSEFDAVWKNNFGVRISAAGWYDYAY